MHKWFYLILLVQFTSLCDICFGEEYNLNTTNALERSQAREAVMKAYDKHITQAMAVLQSEESDTDACLDAIQVLGHLRASKSATLLVNRLKTEAGFINLRETSGPSIGDRYPAAAALVEIGKPAVSQCLKVLKKADSEEQKILCWIIQTVEGSQVAETIISTERERTKDAGERKKLADALTLLKQSN